MIHLFYEYDMLRYPDIECEAFILNVVLERDEGTAGLIRVKLPQDVLPTLYLIIRTLK